jgi:hypothetical protein
MFQANTESKVTFKVNVMGTNTAPSTVRVIIAAQPEERGFVATQDVAQPGTWSAIVNTNGIPTGIAQMRIEVVINGRLLTPIRRNVDIAAQAEFAPVVPTPQETLPVTAEEVATVDQALVEEVAEPAIMPVTTAQISEAPQILTAEPPKFESIFKKTLGAEKRKIELVVEKPVTVPEVKAVPKAEPLKPEPIEAKLPTVEKLAKAEPKKKQVEFKFVPPSPTLMPVTEELASAKSMLSLIDKKVSEVTKTETKPQKRTKKVVENHAPVEQSIPFKISRGKLITR